MLLKKTGKFFVMDTEKPKRDRFQEVAVVPQAERQLKDGDI